MQAIQNFARGAAAAMLGSALAVSASASDLNLTVSSNGQSVISVSAGDMIPYAVVGELSDAGTQGLAMFAFDLAFDGGALNQANAPVSGEMLNFASPLGINNPAGFGGTAVMGDLLQIGGAQNTINNTFAPIPSGMVSLGVALPGAGETLITGSLVAPAVSGTYTLAVSNLMANGIESGTNGIPFWNVVGVEEGNVTQLTINVDVCEVALYCTAKVNSLGCTPTLTWQGTPSLTGPNDFRVIADDLLNQQAGVMFWGLAEANTPWLGGTLCVGSTIHRLPTKMTTGAGAPGTNCNGRFAQMFSQARMNANGLQAGMDVYMQLYYRDPAHQDGSGAGTTAGVHFTICP
ncbi:MAG: hypothetical protein ACI9HE_000161 [Planctomycetota bacterium]|jgi:hypothetical protein